MYGENLGKYRDVGKGWQDLVDAAVMVIHENNGRSVQIKEKFGALRIYYKPINDPIPLTSDEYTAINTAIVKAEQLSEITCECCGDEGILTIIDGWYKTVCVPCCEHLIDLKTPDHSVAVQRKNEYRIAHAERKALAEKEIKIDASAVFS